ncbi:MAG: hypothetical protein ACK53L_26210, partial [Pirellulaceae bacterium]
ATSEAWRFGSDFQLEVDKYKRTTRAGASWAGLNSLNHSLPSKLNLSICKILTGLYSPDTFFSRYDR